MLTDDEIRATYERAMTKELRPQDVAGVMKVARAIETAVIAELTAKPAAWKDVRGWSTTSPLIAQMHIGNGDKLTPLYEIRSSL